MLNAECGEFEVEGWTLPSLSNRKIKTQKSPGLDLNARRAVKYLHPDATQYGIRIIERVRTAGLRNKLGWPGSHSEKAPQVGDWSLGCRKNFCTVTSFC